MCSTVAKEVAASDEALNNAQAAMSSTLNSDYSASFAQQQQVLQQQNAKLNAIASNPMGYSPEELNAQTTAINENTSNAAKQAIGAASAYAAAHGAADTGSGPTGLIAGQIASQAGQAKAAQLSNLSAANAGLKRQNFWTAMNGLQGVGNAFGGAAGTAISGAGSAANSAVGAGKGAVDASQTGIEDVGAVLSGIGGLASAGASAFTGYENNN